MMTSEMDPTGEEFLLPSDFLTDDFFLDGGENKSPTETDSTENDDDEESFMADLTKRMRAHPFLHDQDTAENQKPFSSASLKPTVLGTSPQSTLCGIGSWSFSSNGSPEGPSQVSSPPSTPFPQPRDDALDLLSAAAGQVVRLGLNPGQQVQQSRHGFLGQHRQSPNPKPNPNLKPNPQVHSRPKILYHNQMGGLVPTQQLIQQQLQQARFYQLKRQQILKQQFLATAIARQQQQQQQQQQSREKAVRPLGLSSSAWPPLTKQQQTPAQPAPQPPAGSGMTAVFLNGGARRQSNGTGVFLPRRVGTPIEPKKKPGCSTVLLPARVVQALNLNLNGMEGCSYMVDNDGLMNRSVNGYPKRSVAAPAISQEIRLPQEWTY